MATGGDVLEINTNHPTVGTFTVFPMAEEDSTFDPGGFISEDNATGVDGSGAMVDVMTRKRWMLECVVSWDMNDRKDLEKMKQVAESVQPATFTISHVNGTVWKGKGKPVGDLQGSGKGTFTLKLSGGGKMEQQV